MQSNSESLIRELPQPAWSHPKYYPVQLSVDQVNSTNSLEADAQQVMKEACNDGFALGARNLCLLYVPWRGCTSAKYEVAWDRWRLCNLETFHGRAPCSQVLVWQVWQGMNWDECQNVLSTSFNIATGSTVQHKLPVPRRSCFRSDLLWLILILLFIIL